MESIELSEITVIPQDKVLYSEVLCDKVNSKLKKLHVQIKQTAATDGSKVFTLDIQGIRHKFRLQIDFSPQDVCFLRFDEFNENVREPSCFPCLNRNYYPNLMFSRLMLLLYSDPGDGEEAKCIKVPLLQRGNIMAAAALRKLQYVLHTYIASQDELKHWLVQIVSCIGYDAGEFVFLGVTRHALVIVQDFIIRQYHSFYGNRFTVTSDADSKQLDIIVVNKRDPARFNQYIFKTVHWSSIESTIQSMNSTADMPRPRAHFNILHSEVSASGFIPGTTSDNVTILPHYNFENNNSSSGSNGYLHPPQRQRSEKISNMVTVHNGPEPHITPHNSSNTSNGHIPGSDSDPTVVSQNSNVQLRQGQSTGQHDNTDDSEIHVRHSEIFRLTNKPLLPDLTPPTPHKLVGSPGQNTDPCQTQKDLAVPPRSPSCTGLEEFDNVAFEPGPGDIAAGLVYVDYNDLRNMPPPPPCSAQPHPHGEFFPQKPPTPCADEPETSKSSVLPLPKRSRLPRSISCSLLDIELTDHWYVNVEQSIQWRNSVYEDSPYVRFYYNVGFVRFARMSKKLKRRERLSKELAKVDFNKLENHEKWFDTCYKLRDKDMRFCRLSRTSMNINSEEDPEIYSEPAPETPVPDHPYWNSSLCLTIQRMLQEGPGGGGLVSAEIQRVFDLTHEQLVSVQVLLSLVPSERNWRDLAEHIGLGSGDVSIIEHFCYTYRELPARVVLFHWLTMCEEGKQEVTTDSSFDSLKTFIENIERGDIRNVLSSHNANRHLQSQEDLTFSDEVFTRHVQRPQDLNLQRGHNIYGQRSKDSRSPGNRHVKSQQDLRLPGQSDNRNVKSHLDLSLRSSEDNTNLSLRSRDDNIDTSLRSIDDNRLVESRPDPRMNNLNSYRLEQSHEDLRSQTMVKPTVAVQGARSNVDATVRKELVEHEDSVDEDEEEEFNTRL